MYYAYKYLIYQGLLSFPTRRSSDLRASQHFSFWIAPAIHRWLIRITKVVLVLVVYLNTFQRSEEHTSELQSRGHIVCRLLLEKNKELANKTANPHPTTIEIINHMSN